MARTPHKPKKDPARPTRAKAARPDDKPTPDTLANLLNPGIGRGTAGLGSGTGLQPPPDNSWDRRRDFSDAHKARKSTLKEFNEAPQRDYTASPITGLDPQLAQELGIGDDEAPPAAALKKEDPKYRLPRADLPTQPGGFGGLASQQSLEQLLREGRPEFTATPWTPHRPPRPEKSEGGKKLTMAKVIEATQRPALILAPNKTLAAQLYGEFKSFFPENAVEYFVSYYDYYQPEAYVPRTDTYIEKESTINEQIDRMRHSATRALLERDDVVIVASVSCIYGIGSVETY